MISQDRLQDELGACMHPVPPNKYRQLCTEMPFGRGFPTPVLTRFSPSSSLPSGALGCRYCVSPPLTRLQAGEARRVLFSAVSSLPRLGPHKYLLNR